MVDAAGAEREPQAAAAEGPSLEQLSISGRNEAPVVQQAGTKDGVTPSGLAGSAVADAPTSPNADGRALPLQGCKACRDRGMVRPLFMSRAAWQAWQG